VSTPEQDKRFDEDVSALEEAIRARREERGERPASDEGAEPKSPDEPEAS
jgi:hypothetical protein